MRTHRLPRALGAAAVALALAFTAGACSETGSETGSVERSKTEHNEADVAFATDMLQHHAQALTMVDLTLGRPLDPEVEQLATQIREAQAPEIEQFADWLTAWGEEVPATVRDHANADHGDGESEVTEDMPDDMPGMMSGEQMSALEGASDAEFQTAWLELMVEHHRGALEMAEAEQEDGRYRPAVDLAGEIVSSQTAEIETMEQLLER